MSAPRSPLEWILLFLYPPRCAVCDEAVPIGAGLCGDCARRLAAELEGAALCPLCGKPEPDCVCRGAPPSFSRCLSVFLYREDTRRLFERLKAGDADVAAPLAAMMLGRWYGAGLPAPDAVSFVPARPGRGNQAEALARLIGGELGVKVLDPLTRHQNSRVQHTLSVEQRRENAAASYACREGASVPGRVLLIDDIITTGSTLSACSRLLLRAGAREVVCLTAATTPLIHGENPGETKHPND